MPAASTAAARTRRAGRAACGLPLGRRTPRGRERWYLLRVPENREASTCARLKRLVFTDLLTDAFALRKERWIKRAGVWSLETVPMYRGYAFAISRDACALAKALGKLTVPVELVGSDARAWMPLADEAAAWYVAAMDGEHVIRSSTAVIEEGVLRVTDGPLMGQEARISQVDRHRRRCIVHVGDADSGFAEQMPLDVPFKS